MGRDLLSTLARESLFLDLFFISTTYQSASAKYTNGDAKMMIVSNFVKYRTMIMMMVLPAILLPKRRRRRTVFHTL